MYLVSYILLEGLTICGCNCLSWAEWKSSMKILCRTGPGVGKGDIIVTTRSGGEGTCTVTFRGYMEKIGINIFIFIFV